MKRTGRIVGLATELGMSMGLTAAGLAVLGLVFGRWLDARFGTSPILTIAFILAGAVAGQMALYRLATRSARRLSAGPNHGVDARDALSSAALGLRMLALMTLPALAGLLLGLWTDSQIDTEPVATLVLTTGGLFGGLLYAVRLAKRRLVSPRTEGDET